MPRPKEQTQKVEHKHRFIETKNPEIWYCDQNDCRQVRITQDEYDRRVEEWKNYYQFVQSTDSYKDFQNMREAFFRRNKPEIDRIIKRVKERLETSSYNERPNFDDPRDRNYEVLAK